MSTLYADRTKPNTGRWQDRHDSAINFPTLSKFETSLVEMFKGWAQYALDHEKRYESKIGEDGVLGAYWESMGDGLRGLLNGDCGRLDAGTLDGFILNTMSENGIDVSQK